MKRNFCESIPLIVSSVCPVAFRYACWAVLSNFSGKLRPGEIPLRISVFSGPAMAPAVYQSRLKQRPRPFHMVSGIPARWKHATDSQRTRTYQATLSAWRALNRRRKPTQSTTDARAAGPTIQAELHRSDQPRFEAGSPGTTYA